jgi:hypothetical protein
MDITKTKVTKLHPLPPLRIPHLNLRDDICSTPSTDTGRHTIRYIATARTKKLYTLLGINDGGHIYANMDVKLDDLSRHSEFKKLTSIERTDFCHHLLSFLETEISDMHPKRVRRDVQIPKLKLTSKDSNLYPMAKMFDHKRKRWKNWKQSWFEKSIILTKFFLTSNCDMKSLTPKLREMDISLEHMLIYCIQHKTAPTLLKQMSHIELTLKSIRSYRYRLTPGWLKRATPYIKPALLHSLKRKETHEYLMMRKRHRPFVKELRRKIRREKKHIQKRGIKLPLIIPSSTIVTTQTPLASSATFPSSSPDPFAGVRASAGFEKDITLKK